MQCILVRTKVLIPTPCTMQNVNIRTRRSDMSMLTACTTLGHTLCHGNILAGLNSPMLCCCPINAVDYPQTKKFGRKYPTEKIMWNNTAYKSNRQNSQSSNTKIRSAITTMQRSKCKIKFNIARIKVYLNIKLIKNNNYQKDIPNKMKGTRLVSMKHFIKYHPMSNG